MMSSYKEHLDLKGFDDEEDLSDDEVFTRGGKSIPIEENGVSKPLMAPRQRTRDSLQTKVRKVPPMHVIWAPITYFIVTLGAVIGIICLVVFLINVFMKNIARNATLNLITEKPFIIPCSKIVTEDVWAKVFPMLTTETAIRLSDINSDGIEDIILGFGTGADAFYYPPVVCDVYFHNAKDGCGGGMLALDGKTGREIWRHYTAHEIFAVNCNADLNEDGIKDCIGGGRMAGFQAVNGKNGALLWDFTDQHAKVETSNVYTPQYVKDLDYDGVPDLIVVHGGDPMKEPGSKTRLTGRLMVVSGKTGKVLKWVKVPDGRESYYSPQVLTHPDGTEYVLFGTGGETHGGSLWYIRMNHLLTGQIDRSRAIYTDDKKGIMTPPVLVDITGDGISDIIMAMFNSTVVAFDGHNFTRIWEYHQPSSETYSTPGVGFFNNDTVPDFIINYQTGPGFPIYYYTQTTILDGQNGKPLLEKPIKMVVGTQSSPLVISVEGIGNDVFLYWVSDCHGPQNESQLEFDFLKGTSVHEQSRADFCKLRFKEKLYTRLYALSSHNSVPGNIIYDSDERHNLEFGNVINFTAVGLEFLYRHPEYQADYDRISQKEDKKLDDDSEGEDDVDFPGLYSGLNFQKHYNPQGETSNLYPYINSPISSDQNDYNIGDEQSEENLYPPYYEASSKYGMPGSEPYGSIGYYRNFPGDNAAQYMMERKLRPKKLGGWSNQYLSPKHQIHSSRPLDWQSNVLQDSKGPKFSEEQTLSGISNGWRRKSLRYANKVPRQSENRLHKRHVGPHDGGGIQRVISTGTLAPPLSSHGIDVIFATFWFYPSETQGLLKEDKNCIEARLNMESERFDETSLYYGMDHDAYEDAITEECLKKSGNFKNYASSKLSSIREYNPFDRPMGQLTVYRIHVECICVVTNHSSPASRCSGILPFEEQEWTSYMGRYGNCVAVPRSNV